MTLLKQTKRTAVYLLIRFVAWLFNIVPRMLADYVGGWLGLAAWWLSIREQQIGRAHV